MLNSDPLTLSVVLKLSISCRSCLRYVEDHLNKKTGIFTPGGYDLFQKILTAALGTPSTGDVRDFSDDIIYSFSVSRMVLAPEPLDLGRSNDTSICHGRPSI